MEKPAAGAKTSRSERTKQKIYDSFFRLMSQKKWDKITVKELCAEAEITRGTFYQYFNDIYDLMETLENALLDDISGRYEKIARLPHASIPTDHFIDKFDYAPPKMLLVWFEFCREHQKAMNALLDRKYGDTYFVKRLKVVLQNHINYMMDFDGQPQDSLRTHFLKIFLELHFLSVQTWLEEGEEEFLSVEEIVNLLNAMRVGACYLSYKEDSDPLFHQKMNTAGVL